ncbi:MAG: anti-sigma factor antagonist [Parasporobacterium sp.]|nr:anti-sigma factor antagonist [Parasporobacterium sp.]
MTFELNGNTLTISLEGRIDSSNAESTGKELTDIIAANSHDSIIIDVEDLEYISSAGLRVILKIRKSEPTLKIINASPAVYEVFDITGFTEMLTIEKAYRKLSVEGCEVLGQGSNGVVYRYDPEIVVKVYRNSDALDDIHRERELARKALISGIPTAIPFDVVKVGDKFASVFELLNAQSFSKLILNNPDQLDHYVGLFTDLLKLIHSTDVNPQDMPSMKKTALNWASFLKDHLDEHNYGKLYAMIDEVPEVYTMIHGDYHTNNVEMQNGEVLLIDMDTLSYGHPVFELASMFLGFVGFSELDPSVVKKFLGIDSDTAHEIWGKFLRLYVGTDDETVIAGVADKAMIIGYTRLMRRTIRRQNGTEEGRALIEHCRTRLTDLLQKTDTLVF